MKNKKFRLRSRIVNDLYKENFNRIFNPTLTKNMRGPNLQGRLNGTNKTVGRKIHGVYCWLNEVTNRIHGLILARSSSNFYIFRRNI